VRLTGRSTSGVGLDEVVVVCDQVEADVSAVVTEPDADRDDDVADSGVLSGAMEPICADCTSYQAGHAVTPFREQGFVTGAAAPLGTGYYMPG
jgi:hypothetical protein